MGALRSLIDELRGLLAVPPADPAAADLAEFVAYGLDRDADLFESPMDPFKHKAKIGPGPYGRRNAKRKADRFKCTCSSQGGGSVCKCKSRKRTKTVFVSYDYKNAYNAVYRAWLHKRKKAKLKKKAKPQSFQAKAKIG